MTPLLSVSGVSKRYRSRRVTHTAVEDVSFTLEAGRTIAIVGESGAGKSTMARLIAGLDRPSEGAIMINGVPPVIRSGRPSDVQMVFQHPTDALNPLRSVGASIAAPLHHLRSGARNARVRELMSSVGLDPDRAGDRPRRFSGGQLQRIVIARAVAAEPKLLLCDEPTSALDVSVQAQIVNVILSLQAEHGFGCVLVTHDLAVARVLADDVLVLKDGRTEELQAADAFFRRPMTAYGRALLDANVHRRGSAPERPPSRIGESS